MSAEEQPDPGRFLGKPAEYLLWHASQPQRFNPLWCPTHWMPCPVDGLNGVLASILLQVEAFALVPPDVGTDATALNSWFANITVPVCCQFGSAKMDWLWMFCNNDDDFTQHLCRALPPEGNGRRVCWFPTGHEGTHEWERLFGIFSPEFRFAWGQEAFA